MILKHISLLVSLFKWNLLQFIFKPLLAFENYYIFKGLKLKLFSCTQVRKQT